MRNRLYPTDYFTSTYVIDFEKYYSMGYRAVIFDVDNTLVEHDAPADDRAKEFIQKLKEIGFNICFLSNNDEERVKMFNEQVDCQYIFKAGKPSPKGYVKAMELMNVTKEQTMFVGDQIFTDIWGANNAGIRSVLVQPIAKHEEIQIVLKRIPEKWILKGYLKNYPLRDK
ncbi:MAG: YqeG family HAD IIIA-type phosphatase [Lachnospiraceae bacterium]|nr:YqeG family HAD IIIA-type phosphatase [Lachnospiraceae bacterium]MBQ8165502.1 YqeG family HAD IIIA-type phosphatase [Lachnospiraceae bacterium]